MLECGHEEALGYLTQRLAATDADAVAASNLVEMDEAREVLDKNDLSQLDANQNSFSQQDCGKWKDSSSAANSRQSHHRLQRRETQGVRRGKQPS